MIFQSWSLIEMILAAKFSTDLLFVGVSVFIAVIFLVAFSITGKLYKADNEAFQILKGGAAGTFFAYSALCIARKGKDLYAENENFVWIPVFTFLVLSSYEWLREICCGAGKTRNRSGGPYSETRMDMTYKGVNREEENGDSDEEDGLELVGGGAGGIQKMGATIGSSASGSGTKIHSAEVDLAAMRASASHDFPLFPIIVIALLEGGAIGFDIGNIEAGEAEFLWEYIHLFFNKVVQALSYGCLLQQRLQSEVAIGMVLLVISLSTPVGILLGQIFANVYPVQSVNNETLAFYMNCIFCVASGMYLFISVKMQEDWKTRKMAGNIACLVVAVISTIYRDETF